MGVITARSYNTAGFADIGGHGGHDRQSGSLAELRKMKEFVLVISMWGHTGAEWVYVGNQIVLQQSFTQDQCYSLLQKDMWKANYDNEYFKMNIQCFPKDCAGKEVCN